MEEDPVVAEDKIPAYSVVEEKIRQIDNTVIIARIFYVPDSLLYRFKLVKKDRMCMMEIPKRLLDDVKNDGANSDEELEKIVRFYVQRSDCWDDLQD
jgi:hypothetical protein